MDSRELSPYCLECPVDSREQLALDTVRAGCGMARQLTRFASSHDLKREPIICYSIFDRDVICSTIWRFPLLQGFDSAQIPLLTSILAYSTRHIYTRAFPSSQNAEANSKFPNTLRAAYSIPSVSFDSTHRCLSSGVRS